MNQPDPVIGLRHLPTMPRVGKRTTGEYRHPRFGRGFGPVGMAPRSSYKPKWRLGPSKQFVRTRMPLDLLVKLMPKTHKAYGAQPHPTKSGPGRY